MPDLVKVPRYQVGDQVRLVFGERLEGTIMEARGSYLASGNVLYRIYIPMNPEPIIFDVREDEIEKV